MGRLRKIPNDLKIAQGSKYYFDKLFDNNKPNHIEIGMGKGNFLIQSAIYTPEINFYGLDKYATVVVKAIKKLDKLVSPPPNIKFLVCDVTKITDYIPEHYFDRIYLNFPDPWPKKRHTKRRLTSPAYLKLYKQILKSGGDVTLKTDNDQLYTYTLETINNQKDISIIENTNDYYSDHIDLEIIKTEYEQKYLQQGKKIKLIRFRFINQ